MHYKFNQNENEACQDELKANDLKKLSKPLEGREAHNRILRFPNVLMTLENLVSIDTQGNEIFNKNGVFKRLFLLPFFSAYNESSINRFFSGLILGGGFVAGVCFAELCWMRYVHDKYNKACKIADLIEKS